MAIELSFELDTELAGKVEVKQYKNGEWVKADSRVEDSHVVVAASEFASYGLFLGVEFSEKKSTEAVEFEQANGTTCMALRICLWVRLLIPIRWVLKSALKVL